MSSTNSRAPQTQSSSSIISMPSVTTVKLNHDNFLLWKAQLVPYFKGQELFGYIDDSIPKPPKIISITHPESSDVSKRLHEFHTL